MKRLVVGDRPRRIGLLSLAVALGFACLSGASARGLAAGTRVDAELVLAVDVSSSMQPGELALQREGYSAAFRSKEVIDAIVNGGYGRIAVTYVEWGSSNIHRVVVPWTLVDSAASAHAVADKLDGARIATMFRTSISGAIRDGLRAFDENRYRGLRRIIDVSGDGPNNEGGLVTLARDTAVARGVTINGLPLMVRPLVAAGGEDVPSLDDYYADCVIGGTRAFVLPVTSWRQFPQAVRRKLVLEMSGRDPAVREAAARSVPDVLLPGKGADCQIGEESP